MTGHVKFAKIARINRGCVITEKIDGTNAAVVVEDGLLDTWPSVQPADQGVIVNREIGGEQKSLLVTAQSRSRLITTEDDNFGFASWVRENAESLVDDLGVGLHFGEWWGAGIQRGYGLQKGDRRFSLFNTKRWFEEQFEFTTSEMNCVPVLYDGPFEEFDPECVQPYHWKHVLEVPKTVDMPPWNIVLTLLKGHGSAASPGFDRPEGVVIYHKTADVLFKATVDRDEEPKSASLPAESL